jgi:hypothetical protein
LLACSPVASLPGHDPVPAVSALLPAFTLLQLCKTFADGMNSTKLRAAVGSQSPFSVAAFAAPGCAHSVRISQPHHTEPLRTDWRGCVLSPALDYGTNIVRLRLLLLNAATSQFGADLLMRCVEKIPSGPMDYSIVGSVFTSSIDIMFNKLLPAVFTVLLASGPCSGGYVLRADDDQHALLGAIGKTWYTNRRDLLATTVWATPGTKTTSALIQAHVNQRTVVSVRCLHWILEGETRCRFCNDLVPVVREHRRYLLKSTEISPDIEYVTSSGTFRFSSRVACIDDTGALREVQTQTSLLTEVCVSCTLPVIPSFAHTRL